MKKRICILSLLLLAAACQVQPQPGSEADGSVFTGTIEQASGATRTYMDAARNVLWSEGDEVTIFDGSTLNGKYKVSSGAGTAEAQFSREGADGEPGEGLPVVVAVYPYDAALTCSEEADGFRIEGMTLPRVQKSVENSFGEEANPMVAVSPDAGDKALDFKNLMGFIKIKLTGSALVNRVEVCGNSAEVLAGPAVVHASYSEAPTVSMTGTTRTVTLDCGEGVQLGEEPVSFIIALPPTEFAAGFTVRVYDSQGKLMEKAYNGEVHIARNTITPFSAVMYSETGTDNVRVAMPSASSWDEELSETYFTPNDSQAEGAAFVNDPNSSFVQVSSTDGHVDFSQVTGAHDDIIDLSYRFYTGEGGYSDDSSKIEVYHDAAGNEIKVRFTVENGTVLKASLFNDGEFGTPQTVVSISNESSDGRLNTVVLEENELAETLLNTGEFRIRLDAEGILDGGESADIRFGTDRNSASEFFTVRYDTPVDVDKESPMCFLDYVDFGEKGSWLRLEDLVEIVDWRGRNFRDYPNYWSYYGPFVFSADIDNVTCDMSGNEGMPLPVTIELTQIDPEGNIVAGNMSMGNADVSTWTPSEYGYLAYKNNGITLQREFVLIVPMKVKYGFGYINQTVRIPVRTIY